jgi:hydrogenase maturation protease
MNPAPPPNLVLGLGNDILTDDAVGLRVTRELEQRLRGVPGVEVLETSEMGLALLDFFTGRHKVVLVDSVHSGKALPGTIHEVAFDNPRWNPSCPSGPRTPHFLGVNETLALGHQLGLEMPRVVRAFAVEVSDPFTLSAEMTPALESALPRIVEQVALRVQRVLDDADVASLSHPK